MIHNECRSRERTAISLWRSETASKAIKRSLMNFSLFFPFSLPRSVLDDVDLFFRLAFSGLDAEFDEFLRFVSASVSPDRDADTALDANANQNRLESRRAAIELIDAPAIVWR